MTFDHDFDYSFEKQREEGKEIELPKIVIKSNFFQIGQVHVFGHIKSKLENM